MYKKFFMGIAAMAAMTLVSCSSDDLNSLSDNSSKNEAISFDGYWGRSAVAVNGSRASELTKDALQESAEGFGVFGNYSSTEFTEGTPAAYGNSLFDNQPITYDKTNSKWTYSPLKFWPTQGHIDFLAYAPYDATIALKKKDATETALTCIDFKVDKEIAKQKDLLWANVVGQTKDKISTTGKKVKFHFYHALSRLGYTVKLYGNGDYSSNKATFTVDNITLAGSPDGTSENAFYKKGTIDLSKANNAGDLWNTSSANGAKQKFDLVSNKPLGKDGIKSDKEYLFVIPQDFSQEGNTLYVYVKYTINYTDGTQPVTNTVYKKLTTNFKQGKAYMLNLTLGLPIEFDVDVVEKWIAPEDGTGDINIGSNDNNPWDKDK